MKSKRGKRTIAQGSVLVGIRRVVRLGNSLCITLPEEWVKKHRIEPGDDLAVVGNTILKIVPVKE
ncbi:hypothetical protein DRP04_12540 [Archaeoglobales archaeon]|nr:MAG: hypothetical protein DRP04_12540 [Archaeoglobales archaeon]